MYFMLTVGRKERTVRLPYGRLDLALCVFVFKDPLTRPWRGVLVLVSVRAREVNVYNKTLGNLRRELGENPSIFSSFVSSCSHYGSV